MNRWKAFKQLLLTRFREFYREPVAIFWTYGFPLLLAIILGFAFSSGGANPPDVDLVNQGDKAKIEALAKELCAQKFKVEIVSSTEGEQRLKQGKTSLLVYPTEKSFEFHFDPVRSESFLASKWVESIYWRSQNPSVAPPTERETKEPGSRYIDFLLPGLIGLNIMGGGLFGIGFVLVDMRVRKLFKRLLATPMRHSDFLLSILTARLVFLVPEMLALLLMGWYVFEVPQNGNPLLLCLVILFGAVAFAGIGLLIACRTEKTETISGLLNAVMLPSYLLCGVFFTSRRFPEVVQPLIQALPLTQLIDAMREVMLEGLSLDQVWWRLAILAAWGVVAMLLALKWFRWR